jgi:penicillin-insensitive murein DD-endopeptidase
LRSRPVHSGNWFWLSAFWLLGLLLCAFTSNAAFAGNSQCFGTTSNGRLENGKRLPEKGPNFAAYSTAGVLAGRTFAHSEVVSVVTQAYLRLERSAPGKTFLYGESGWPAGGRFRPHRTHQNGLSVDFMVPVLDRKGVSVPLPTSVANKFGYGIEFDRSGKWEGYRIDFDALGEHLYELHVAAKQAGMGIGLVILDPDYILLLRATRHGQWLDKNVKFMKSKPWVRHDDHYHVDFIVPCRPLN